MLTFAALSTVVLLAGYADLWRGGTEFSAIALAIGYAFLIPATLLQIGRGDPAERGTADASHRFDDTPWLAGGIAALAVFALYAATLAPTTAMWDTSEYITAAKTFGVPHPPGNPVFVLLAHAFGTLPLPMNYGARINLMAAVCSAAAAGLWFVIVSGILRSWLPQKWQRFTGAGVAVLISATAFTVWNQSVVNEKVYTVALLGVAVISWFALRWSDDPASPSSDRYLVTAAYLIGLGYANHPAGFLPIPAVGLLMLTRQPTSLLRWRLLASCIATLLLGLSAFTIMPIRAAHGPALNSGAVAACDGAPTVSCLTSDETRTRVMAHINREQYGGHAVSDRKAPITAQYGMFWLYFKWQWLRDAYNEHPGLQAALAVIFLALGLYGGTVHFARDRRSFWYLGGLVFTLTVALVIYLNFKYGHSQAPELGNSVDREVRDRDYFYLWSFSVWGLWAGMGLTAFWTSIAALLGKAKDAADARTIDARGFLMAAPVLLLALVPLIGNWQQAPRKGQTFTLEWARDLLNSVEPYGILVTNGDNDSFPMWYAQEVEGIRRDVLVVVLPYLGTEWYATQLQHRTIEPYDKEAGPAIYRDRDWPMPEGEPWPLSDSELEAVPLVVALPEAQRFVHENLDATIPAGYLTRDQQLMLYLVKSQFPKRSFHFTLGGGYPQSLGFGPYLVGQGLTQRLVNERVQPSEEIMPIGGGTYIDVARTEALWNLYGAPKALIGEGNWIDDASSSIPYMYGVTGQFLASALETRGEAAEADSVMNTVVEMARASRLR